MDCSKKVAWNKGKKQAVKKLNYTNGTVNIKVIEGETPPEGFYRGQVRHIDAEKFKKNKELQIEKTRQTKIERYGSTSYNNLEKRKQTCVEKYGAEQYLNSDDFKEKAKATSLEHYGVENPMSSPEVKERRKQLFTEKYGVENPHQMPEVIEKTKNTMIERYGASGTWNSPELMEKVKSTCIEKYGVDTPMASTEVKEKLSATIQDKYGFDWACLRPEARITHSAESGPNKQFEQLLIDNGIQYEREFVIGRKAYDFKVDNTLIEINPSITHNINHGIFDHPGLGENYHKEKSKLAHDNNYRCIHVWDWDDQDKIIQLLQPRESTYARKCRCAEITEAQANDFISTYHLQGSISCKRAFALIFENEIVAVMSFGPSRYTKKYEWELLRYATKMNITGGAEKLFKFSVEQLQTDAVLSYCDFSKFDGHTYEKLGFKLVRTSLGVHWYNYKTKKHITDNLLRQLGFDKLLGNEYGCFGKGTSNEELIRKFNFVKICDAGQGTFVWKRG